jgi:maltodextrin utilization protein YvdJ
VTFKMQPRKHENTKKTSIVFRVFVVSWLHLVFVFAIPRAALACPVCFGQNDSPLAQAMNSGIIFMLVVVAVVLAAFASFFIYLMRRARLVAQQSEGTAQ